MTIKTNKPQVELTFLTPKQCAAGRAIAGLTQKQLAEEAGVTEKTVIYFETGKSKSNRSTMGAIRRALEHAGVVFIAGNGTGPGVAERKRDGE